MSEDFWHESARELAVLLSSMHNVDPYNLGENPQKALAAYRPRPGMWTEKEKALHQQFVKMDRTTFLTIYDTFRAGQYQKGSDLVKESGA